MTYEQEMAIKAFEKEDVTPCKKCNGRGDNGSEKVLSWGISIPALVCIHCMGKGYLTRVRSDEE